MTEVTTTETDTAGLIPSSEKFTFGKNWLTISEDATRPEWLGLVERLALIHQSSQLWLGDAIRHGERRGFYTDPKVYDELEAITRLKRGTLQQYRSVAERTSCTRVQDLDYAHHRQVAGFPPDEQRIFLQRAADGRWTVQQLRREIQKASRPTADDELRAIQNVNKRIDDEREAMRAKMSRLLEEINALPPAFRRQIKKAIMG